MTNGKHYYLATRGDERVIGTISEIAALLGKTEHYVHKLLWNHYRTRAGWRVERYKIVTSVYIAEHPDDDPIIGPAEEVACLLGYSIRYVRRIAQNGTKSGKGWTIRREEAE